MTYDHGAFLAWDDFAQKFNLEHIHLFKWIQIKNSIPKQWVKIIKDSGASNLYYLKPHINVKERIVCIKKMTSTEFYKLMCDKICKPPTSILTHQNKFQVQFDLKQWEHIFMIPRYSCSDSYTRIFQFKILHNILFLNDRLYNLNLSDTKLCSLCAQENETPEH